MKIAIVGFTGGITRELVNLIDKSKIQVENLVILDNSNLGTGITFRGYSIGVQCPSKIDLTNFDFLFHLNKSVTYGKFNGISIGYGFGENPFISGITKNTNNNLFSPKASSIQLIKILDIINSHDEVDSVVVSTYQSFSDLKPEMMEDRKTHV